MRRMLAWLPHLRRSPVIHRIDVELFRRAASSETPALDAVLPRLSWVANGAVLWVVIAALLGLAGGRRGRRAAVRGLVSVASAAFVANIPAKLFWRRARPSIAGVPATRRLARQPRSTSFPSGHSASAFAFATGVALENPVLGVPLLGLAGLVAYSRVYTGVHYPSDVVAGAVIGAAAAIATLPFGPLLEAETPTAPAGLDPRG